MGDDATVRAKPRQPPTVGGAAVGDLGNLDRKTLPVSGVVRCPQTRGGDEHDAHTPPGTALERKKSYHPELRPAADMDTLVPGLGHKMELIHLNRTCTSVDLSVATASASPSRGLASSLRRASDANLTDEEKVHRVRHQVSFAQDVGVSSGTRAVRCEDLASALKSRMLAGHLRASALPEELPEGLTEELSEGPPVVQPGDSDQDEEGEGPGSDTPDNNSCQEEDDQDDVPYAFLDAAVNLSPDSDVDYLAVRPSLASTQLNEVRGPN